jgi:hypothetical protein
MTMGRSVLIAACVLLSACAPKTLRLAEQINHFAADYQPTPGDSMRAPLEALEKRLADWGVTVGEIPPTFGGIGLASAENRTILLKPGLSVNARFEVLAHEAGHLLQPPTLGDQAVAQLFAELVGVGVQKFYGSQTAELVAARYLAQFKYAFAAEKHLRTDIQYAVEALTGQRPLPAWKEAK